MYNERVRTRVFEMPSQAVTVLRALGVSFFFVILVSTMENTQANLITTILYYVQNYLQQSNTFYRMTGIFQSVDQVF